MASFDPQAAVAAARTFLGTTINSEPVQARTAASELLALLGGMDEDDRVFAARLRSIDQDCAGSHTRSRVKLLVPALLFANALTGHERHPDETLKWVREVIMSCTLGNKSSLNRLRNNTFRIIVNYFYGPSEFAEEPRDDIDDVIYAVMAFENRIGNP